MGHHFGPPFFGGAFPVAVVAAGGGRFVSVLFDGQGRGQRFGRFVVVVAQRGVFFDAKKPVLWVWWWWWWRWFVVGRVARFPSVFVWVFGYVIGDHRRASCGRWCRRRRGFFGVLLVFVVGGVTAVCGGGVVAGRGTGGGGGGGGSVGVGRVWRT